MIALSTEEAQIFRLLREVFGDERVIPHLSVKMICGGELPSFKAQSLSEEDRNSIITGWASKEHCLFTIVDADDIAKLVIDIEQHKPPMTIDINELQRARILDVIFSLKEVKHVVIKQIDLDQILDPNSSIDLVTFINASLNDQ